MISLDAFVTSIEAELKVVYTEEQLKFIKQLDSPGICFASPGTGKTASAVAGLLTAELYKKIPGDKIYALSFTNMATLELSVRHQEACKKLGVSQLVNFQTLHKMCSGILRNNCKLLGMEKYQTVKEFGVDVLGQAMLGCARERNIELDPYKVRALIQAIRSLNSSLTFERDNVESKVAFKDIGISYDDFQILRKQLYEFDKNLETVEAPNIMLYTLELLLEYPEVSKEFKSKCKLLLVDEAQDLSLLQLRILSLLSDNLVLIGDIKQQIYAFNGACQEIVGQYLKYFPNAWQLEFTRSFRCLDNIAAYATKLILPNKVGGENFKGRGEGGIVTIEEGIDYPTICERINQSYLSNKRNFKQGILFLFRNNLSSIPVAEEFFKRKTPFRINNYTPVTCMPIIKDLCALVDLASNPYSYESIGVLKFLVPEFRDHVRIEDNPFYKYMREKRCSMFDVNYKFRDAYCGERAMGALLEVSDMVMRGARAGDIFNKIYPIYYDYWLKARERFLEYDAAHYFQLANYVLLNKSYRQLVADELDKVEFIEDCNNRRLGVRCYTFHAAKGLEDDIVYMIDCDEGIVPNRSKLVRMINKGCMLDAAREVRNERSLVYVASTRAKNELHIHYNRELASVLTSDNQYLNLDMMYESFRPNYQDVEVFQEFYRKDKYEGDIQ